jgi:chromosome segregation ATPase
MRKRKYSQLDSLTSSRNVEISRLSIIVRSLEERMESIEESHNDLLHKVNSLNKEIHSLKPKGKKISRYACDMCGAKFIDSKHLQSHRKNAHKAPYNI